MAAHFKKHDGDNNSRDPPSRHIGIRRTIRNRAHARDRASGRLRRHRSVPAEPEPPNTGDGPRNAAGDTAGVST